MPDLKFSRIDRRLVHLNATATLFDGAPATITALSVALLAPGTTPTATTTWTAAGGTTGAWTVLVAGPDADPTGALVVPAGPTDVWVRDIDNPETTAVVAGRVIVR